ncbi:MAG: hypothetical protein KDI88_02315 [Gammaproteobacteria bacterium]|nr:hypothetical protein [Gammaproteobacteria bacterium]
MQQSIPTIPHSASGLDLHLSALAAVDAGSAPFLSCFLDARQGEAACRDFLTDRYLELADGIPAAQRALLDEAMVMADAAFAHHWPSGVQTVAVFARPGCDERFLQVLPLVDAIPAQVDWYRLPRLLPLMEAAATRARFTMLLGRQGAMYVVDVTDGRAETRAWASPRRTGPAKGQGPDPQTIALRRALLEQSALPLVVAAAAADVDDLVGWLPSRSRARFVERVEVPDYLDFNRAVRFVIEDFQDRRRLEEQLEVSRLIRASRDHGMAVLGPLACTEALRGGAVETLVLARGVSFPRVRYCQRCGAQDAWASGAVPCVECGEATPMPLDFANEIAYLAKRRRADIVFSDAEELRYLGGVGCLLPQSAEASAMPLPTPRRHGLDLVA